jgi:di/tricarboxylate transporter
MGWEAWLTLVVLLAMMVVLARDIVPPSVAVIASVVALLVAGVVTPAQAFSGFSNPAPLTVAALYVLARAVEKTGALQPIVSATLGAGTGLRSSLARLLVPTAAASAFLNNTPIVAMLISQVTEWADRQGRSPSFFLMPLSFAAILGGVVTLIGTSTNLVVSGLLEASGQEPLSMFELTRVGLPIALVGLMVIIVLAPVVLPERRAPRREMEEEAREFVVGMDVVSGGTLDGNAVASGGLRNLQGVFLVEIERGDQVIAPVAPDTVLHGGDRLTFVGRADMIVDLQSMRGLVSREREHIQEFDTHRNRFFEAVVGATSPLVGKTVKEIGFRGRYQAAVVAIHRAGQRVQAKLGTVRLKVGDTLLVLADPGFQGRWQDRTDFLLVSGRGGTPPAVTRRAAVDLDVVLVIAGAFGLAAALQVSGLGARLAGLVVGSFGGLGPVGGLLGIMVATVALLSLITNNAAAVLMFPIAMSTAQELALSSRPFAIALAVVASASFLTPISYQTNIMVYGPGGYRFGDYARLGVILMVVVVAVALWLVPRYWPL